MRHALRGLRRSPGFAATVVLILALGIGANTAIFSIVYGVLLRPLPYPEPGAIVRIGESVGPGNVSGLRLTNRSMPLLQENAESFEQLAAYQELSAEWSGITLRGASVSPSLLPLLRVRPHLGRLFLEEEAQPGAERVMLLSHSVWTQRFAADPSVVGTTLDFGGDPHLVVGVLAEGFHFPTPDSEFWMPYVIGPVATENAARQPGGVAFVATVRFKVLGRLRPGVSAEQAGTEANSILQGNSNAFPALVRGSGQLGVRVVPLLEEMVGAFRPALSILAVVTVLVLLVACLNSAGILLARGVERRRTIAISAALGASRGRLVRQLLTESTVLSLGGGALGLAAAAAILRAVPALAPDDVARLDEVSIDGVAFAFAAGLSILVGLLCAAALAFQGAQLNLAHALNDRSRQFGGGSGLLRTHRVRTALSTMQVAVAVALLIGAGLLLRSFVQLLTFDRGFEPSNVVTATVVNPMGALPHEVAEQWPRVMAEQQRLQERLSAELRTRLASVADVQAVGLARSLPLRTQPAERGSASLDRLSRAEGCERDGADEAAGGEPRLHGCHAVSAARGSYVHSSGRAGEPACSRGQRDARPRTPRKPAGRRPAGDRGKQRTLGDHRHRARHRVRRSQSRRGGAAGSVLPRGPGQREVLWIPPGCKGRGPDRQCLACRDSVSARSDNGSEPASDDQ